MSRNRMSRFSFALGLISLSGLLLFPVCVHAISPELDDEDDVEIVVVPEEGESADPPRSPSGMRISAWYSWDICSVSACLSNAGDIVNVEFRNCSTGECYCFEIPGSGLSLMPIGCSSGYWIVRFSLSSGINYRGVFVL